jgi:uncharacterized membrane protein YdjX (TVP38/TMEM64 family)
MVKKRVYESILVVVGVVFLGWLFYKFGIAHYFTLENIKKHTEYLASLVVSYYPESVLLFIGVYSLAIGLSLPMVGPLAIIGGYLFGTFAGTLYATIGATVGAVTAFLILQHVVGVPWKAYYETRFAKFAHRVKEDGAWYLLMLQFLSIFPFIVINMLAVLGNLSVITVLWTSAVGSMPFIFIYALAGNQIRTISSLRDIWSPKMMAILIVLAGLAVVPLIIKKMWKMHKK